MRGQAHTLEAIIAGLLLLSAITFSLQMTAVTPLSASTSSQHIENQQAATAQGVLAAAAEEDSLKRTLLYWNNSTGSFHDATDLGYYTGETPNTTFGTMLERSFDANGVAYNVYVVFETEGGARVRQRIVYQGVPSDNAVSASRTVTVMDNDRLREADLSLNRSTIENASSYFADDVGGAVYNVMRVEVVAWRV